MNINKRAKVVVAAVALIGTAGIAGNAFTGTGVTTINSAAAPQFVGGQVSQTVTGATLSDIAYSFVDATNTKVNAVDLKFADNLADGFGVTIVVTGGVSGSWTCGDIANKASHCTTTLPQTGVNKIDVTVASSLHP